MYLRLSPYQEILQSVLTDLEVNEGIIKITGKSGAGKTALCSQLYRELESKGQHAVFFLTPPASATALQNSILDNLKLSTAGNFTRTLSAWLSAQAASAKPLVLILDDAQHLDQQTFGAIRMLCNIQESARALVRVILCGTGELDTKLATPALRAVTQFFSQSITLPFLTREQVNDFCQGYWQLMGIEMKPLQEKALQKLFIETQGRPGILQARLSQGSTGAEKFERGNDEAEPDVDTRPGKYPGQRPGWIPAILITLGLVIGVYLLVTQTLEDNETAAVVATAAPPAPAPEPEITTEPVAEEPPPLSPVVDQTREPASEAVQTADLTETPSVDAVSADVTEAPVPAEPEVIDVVELLPVETFIAAWADSWQRRDIDAYLAHYHPEFTPPQELSLTEWQDQRRRVIGNAGDIVIRVDPPEFTADLQDDKHVVRFWLYYSTATYADRTLKELLLVPLDGNWRILAENNMRTERD